MDLRLLAVTSVALVLAFGLPARADTGSCAGRLVALPFTDTQGNAAFCDIATAFFSGITNGTTTVTYTPQATVTRDQMAAFVTRTQQQTLRRGSIRAATRRWWTPAAISAHFPGPRESSLECDGHNVWAAGKGGTVLRLSEGRLDRGDFYNGFAGDPSGIVAAFTSVYVVTETDPGMLYELGQADGNRPLTVAADLGAFPRAVAFDGRVLWTANERNVSRIRLSPTPLTQTIGGGFLGPTGILYDGHHIWVADQGDRQLKKLDGNGLVVGSVAVDSAPRHPVFDGMNIWVPNEGSHTVTVVRVKDANGAPLSAPFVLASLSGNGLEGPFTAAFDGERVLVTNRQGGRFSLWRAASLAPLGVVETNGAGAEPWGACNDGLHFYVGFRDGGIARF